MRPQEQSEIMTSWMGKGKKTRRGIHHWRWWSCVCISSYGRRIRWESGAAPYDTRILRWGYSRSDSYTRTRRWGGWWWGPRHGMRGWPLHSSCWGPPPSWRGSSGAGMTMEAATLSPKSKKEWLQRCVCELINNQIEASFILRWVKKGIKI
jgi:hypothetical protein